MSLGWLLHGMSELLWEGRDWIDGRDGTFRFETKMGREYIHMKVPVRAEVLSPLNAPSL
jgi:hypothetical protein